MFPLAADIHGIPSSAAVQARLNKGLTSQWVRPIYVACLSPRHPSSPATKDQGQLGVDAHLPETHQQHLHMHRSRCQMQCRCHRIPLHVKMLSNVPVLPSRLPIYCPCALLAAPARALVPFLYLAVHCTSRYPASRYHCPLASQQHKGSSEKEPSTTLLIHGTEHQSALRGLQGSIAVCRHAQS